MVSAGLVGFGYAGRWLHLPLMRAAGMRIVAVVSRQVDAVRAAAPDAQVLEDPAELWSRRDVDLVVIATPNHLHAPLARAALECGKHVVIDKPIALRSEDADRLIELAASRGRTLAVFQNRRWDSDYLTLRKLLAAGRVGEPLSFHARWDRFRPEVKPRWRERTEAGGGVLFDLGSHLIDQTLCLFGFPEWVQADVFTQRPGAVTDDGFEILLGRGRLRITLGVSSMSADGGWRYRLQGTRGAYLKAGLDVQERQLLDGCDPLEPQFGCEPQCEWGTLVDASDGSRQAIPAERGAWLDFYRLMRLTLEEGAPPPVRACEARNVLQVIEAALESSRCGRRVVTAA